MNRPEMSRLRWPLAFSLLSLEAPLSAAEVPAGEPIPIEAEFTVTGLDYQTGRAAAMDEGGRFLVVWYQFFGGYGARGYAATGEGYPQFPVNPYSPAWSSDPFDSVALGADDFAIVREDSGASLLGQRHGADGAMHGAGFTVATPTEPGSGSVYHPSIARTPDGWIAVAWTDDDGMDSDIVFRFVDPDGGLTTPVPVNSFQAGDQDGPEIAVGPEEAVLVVWRSAGSPEDDDDGTSIQGRRFAPDGTPGPQRQINDLIEGDQSGSDAAIGTDGRSLVVWRGPSTPGAAFEDIRARFLAADGLPEAAEFRVNTSTGASQRLPRVIARPDGGYQVVWNAANQRILGQALAADGRPIGNEFQISEAPLPGPPAVAGRTTGEFVVAWPLASNYGGPVSARRFRLRLFADGFESGDTSAWGATVP